MGFGASPENKKSVEIFLDTQGVNLVEWVYDFFGRTRFSQMRIIVDFFIVGNHLIHDQRRTDEHKILGLITIGRDDL